MGSDEPGRSRRPSQASDPPPSATAATAHSQRRRGRASGSGRATVGATAGGRPADSATVSPPRAGQGVSGSTLAGAGGGNGDPEPPPKVLPHTTEARSEANGIRARPSAI